MAAVTAVAGEFVHRPVHLSALIPVLKASLPPPFRFDTTAPPLTLQYVRPRSPLPADATASDGGAGLSSTTLLSSLDSVQLSE